MLILIIQLHTGHSSRDADQEAPSIRPEVLKALAARVPCTGRMLNIAMPQVVLNGARIVFLLPSKSRRRAAAYADGPGDSGGADRGAKSVPTTHGCQKTGPYSVALTTHHELSCSDSLKE